MKKGISVLLLCSLLLPPLLAAQQASSLGEEILADLLILDMQIRGLQQHLEALERNSIAREKLIGELEANRLKREALLRQLSQFADQQAAAYRGSLRRWKFLTASLGTLSAALAGVAVYQRAIR